MSNRTDGILVLLGTPIGNLGDCSDRMKATLEIADVIVAEDTRRLRKLLVHLGISKKRFLSYHPGNFKRRTEEILEGVRSGKTVVVTTDAGMPLVSDPGWELVSRVIQEGFQVDCVPGPSAVIQAVVLSGFRADRFCFEGFLPRTTSRRRKILGRIAAEDRPTVVFEAPHRLLNTLCDAREVMGKDRQVAVCREMTKIHQEVVRGDLEEAIAHFSQHKPRGEFTIVFGPAGRVSIGDAKNHRKEPHRLGSEQW
ncbi:MAG: 16S rRNA (cytidine(1402)-2'-O)-methyltransferase [Acidimicrobiia bacterium]